MIDIIEPLTHQLNEIAKFRILGIAQSQRHADYRPEVDFGQITVARR